jgi:hypothetical protein
MGQSAEKKISLRGLVASSILYLASASIGTIVAIQEHLPAQAAGIVTGNDVLKGFLGLDGTALSAPLAFLVGQLILTVLVVRRGWIGMVGVVGLTVVGFFFTVAQIAEPIMGRAFNPATFDLAPALILMVNLISSALMLVFGIIEWRSRRQQRRAVSG